MLKSKTIYILLFLLCLLLLISCNRKNAVYDRGDEEAPTEIEEVNDYFSIQLNFGESDNSRSQNEDLGTDTERSVKEVRIVLYEIENNTVKYCWDLDATNIDEDDNSLVYFKGEDVAFDPFPPTKDKFVSAARSITRADYKMLVLINPSDYLKELTKVSQSVKLISEPIKRNYTDFFEYSYHGSGAIKSGHNFVMTNHKGLADVLELRDFYLTPQQAQANPVYVPVERILAKVVVDAKTLVAPEGVFFGMEPLWDLDLRNQKTFLLRQQTHIAGGTTMERPEDNDRSVLYAEDPNFNKLSLIHAINSSQEISLKQQQADNFLYLDSERDFTTSMGTPNYAFENTMLADDQYMDVTTSVIVKVQYALNELSHLPYNHFFTYKSIAIPYTILEQYSKKTLEIPDELSGLDVIIDLLKSQQYKLELDNPLDLKESFSLYGLNFYKNGYCYYRIPIRHFDDTLAPGYMEYGRYGIVRNNVYNIEIKSITGPGMPVLTVPEAESNDSKMNIQVEFKVEDWRPVKLEFEF